MLVDDTGVVQWGSVAFGSAIPSALNSCPDRTCRRLVQCVRSATTGHPAACSSCGILTLARGRRFFEALYFVARRSRSAMHRNGTGVPVQAWSSARPDEPPPAPPVRTQRLTVIVPILDGEFLGRRRWREWLEHLPEHGNVVVLPWAVHEATSQVPAIGPLAPSGIRRLVRGGPSAPAGAFEACVIRARSPRTPQPLRLFISYARKDGRDVAHKIRQSLQDYGHLSVFLDEHDLQPGSSWRDDLGKEMDNGAAMFAVVSDAYASRAWCREELRRADGGCGRYSFSTRSPGTPPARCSRSEAPPRRDGIRIAPSTSSMSWSARSSLQK